MSFQTRKMQFQRAYRKFSSQNWKFSAPFQKFVRKFVFFFRKKLFWKYFLDSKIALLTTIPKEVSSGVQIFTCWMSYYSYDSSTFQNRKPLICSAEHVYSSFDNSAKIFPRRFAQSPKKVWIQFFETGGFPQKTVWTRRMQFWHPCRKINVLCP